MRNVVLVTIDSLRADHCGFISGCGLTPALDSLAENGVAFTNAVAPGPSTSESMPAIFTGSYPVSRTDSDVAFDERIARIRPHMRTRQTIAEQFASAGYQTAAFTPNPFTSRHFGFQQGFDYFEDFLDGSRHHLYDRLFSNRGTMPGYLPLRVFLNWVKQEEAFKPWTGFYDQVVKWTQATTEPYFLWIFLMDTHHPYIADKEHRSQSLWETYYANWKLRNQGYEPPLGGKTHNRLLTAYEDTVSFVDSFLNRLTADLADDNPMYVVTSDHGESFGEHDTYEHHGGALGNHGAQETNVYMHEENIHVPLVVGNVNQSETIEQPVSVSSLKRLLSVSNGGVDISTAATEPYALSRTLNGRQVAVRGKSWKHVTVDEEPYIYDVTAGETAINNNELDNICQSIISRHRKTQREREKLVKAAKTVGTHMQ